MGARLSRTLAVRTGPVFQASTQHVSVGILLIGAEVILNIGGVKTSIGDLLSDPALMNQAFELSKSLVTRDGTADEKAEAFNAHLKAWATAEGYEIGTAALNVIRETAYAAVKAESEI